MQFAFLLDVKSEAMRKNIKTLILDNFMITAERLVAGDGFGNYLWKGRNISGLLCTAVKNSDIDTVSIKAFEAVDSRMLSASDKYSVEFKGYQVPTTIGDTRILAFIVSGELSEIHLSVDFISGVHYVFVIDPSENTIKELGLEKISKCSKGSWQLNSFVL